MPATWTTPGTVHVSPTDDNRGVRVRWSLGRKDGEAAELCAWFDPGLDGRPATVQLSLPDGLTPSVLQRFPWARWLAVAESATRLPPSVALHDLWDTPQSAQLDAAVDSAAAGNRPPRGSGGRPGRRGHPDPFYANIAARYVELRSQGSTNPTAQIARERHANRNTVAGWLRGARQRRYLPPARPGRPG